MNAGDYETLASVLAESPSLEDMSPENVRGLVLDFADKLCATSERFDPVRFANTCGAGVFSAQDVMEYSHALHLRVMALTARRRN